MKKGLYLFMIFALLIPLSACVGAGMLEPVEMIISSKSEALDSPPSTNDSESIQEEIAELPTEGGEISDEPPESDEDTIWNDDASAEHLSIPETALPQESFPDTLHLRGKNIEVSTAEEFVRAIAPDTCITVNAGLYDVSMVANIKNPHVLWTNSIYDDYKDEKTLVIRDVDGLTIQAAPGAEVEIVTPWRFAEVLSFSNCNNVSLSGIKAGHSVTGEYECDNGVVGFSGSSEIFIEDCYFYGCGTVGLSLSGCRSVTVRNVIITDCSRAATMISDSSDIEYSDCKLIDNRAYQYIISVDGSDAVFNNCKISGNKNLLVGVIEIDFFPPGDSHVIFDHCTITNNTQDAGNSWGESIIVSANEEIYEREHQYSSHPYIGIKDCVIELGQYKYYWDTITDLGGNVLN